MYNSREFIEKMLDGYKWDGIPHTVVIYLDPDNRDLVFESNEGTDLSTVALMLNGVSGQISRMMRVMPTENPNEIISER